jgi:hypothetical protein
MAEITYSRSNMERNISPTMAALRRPFTAFEIMKIQKMIERCEALDSLPRDLMVTPDFYNVIAGPVGSEPGFKIGFTKYIDPTRRKWLGHAKVYRMTVADAANGDTADDLDDLGELDDLPNKAWFSGL